METYTLHDINDLACEIGSEIENLIQKFGNESVNEIISKCITALVMLESLLNEREKACCEIDELNDKISKMEKSKNEKSENHKIFEQVTSSF
jgi:CII-binding regulator of phage lambda lysogenization HflD